MVRVRDGPRPGGNELAGGAGAASGRGQPQGVGRQPHRGGGTGAKYPAECAGNGPPSGPLGGGLPQPYVTLRRQSPAAAPCAANNTLNNDLVSWCGWWISWR